MPINDDLTFLVGLETDFDQGKQEAQSAGKAVTASFEQVSTAAKALGIDLATAYKQIGEGSGIKTLTGRIGQFEDRFTSLKATLSQRFGVEGLEQAKARIIEIESALDMTTSGARLTASEVSSLVKELSTLRAQVDLFESSKGEFFQQLARGSAEIIAPLTQTGERLNFVRSKLIELNGQEVALLKLRSGAAPASDAFRILTQEINTTRAQMGKLENESDKLVSGMREITLAEQQFADQQVRTTGTLKSRIDTLRRLQEQVQMGNLAPEGGQEGVGLPGSVEFGDSSQQIIAATNALRQFGAATKEQIAFAEQLEQQLFETADAEYRLAQAGVTTTKELDKQSARIQQLKKDAEGDKAATAQVMQQERQHLELKQQLGVATDAEIQRLNQLKAAKGEASDVEERLAASGIVTTKAYEQQVAQIDADMKAMKDDEFATGQLIIKKARLTKAYKEATQATKVNVNTLSTAGFAVQNFSFLTQDAAQFSQGFAAGFRAIGNNIDSMLFALIQVNQQLTEQNVSFGTFLKQAAKSPAVIAFASLALLNLATSAIQWIAAARKGKDAAADLADSFGDIIKIQKEFGEFTVSGRRSLEPLIESTQRLQLETEVLIDTFSTVQGLVRSVGERALVDDGTLENARALETSFTQLLRTDEALTDLGDRRKENEAAYLEVKESIGKQTIEEARLERSAERRIEAKSIQQSAYSRAIEETRTALQQEGASQTDVAKAIGEKVKALERERDRREELLTFFEDEFNEVQKQRELEQAYFQDRTLGEIAVYEQAAAYEQLANDIRQTSLDLERLRTLEAQDDTGTEVGAIETKRLQLVDELGKAVARNANLQLKLENPGLLKALSIQQEITDELQLRQDLIAKEAKTDSGQQQIGFLEKQNELEERRNKLEQTRGQTGAQNLEEQVIRTGEIYDAWVKLNTPAGKQAVILSSLNDLNAKENEFIERRIILESLAVQTLRAEEAIRDRRLTSEEQITATLEQRRILESGRADDVVIGEEQVKIEQQINENIAERIRLSNIEQRDLDEIVDRETRRLAQERELDELIRSTRRIDILDNLEQEAALQEEKNENAFVEVELLQDYNSELARRFALAEFEKEIAGLQRVNALQEESLELLREDEILRNRIGVESLVKELDALEKKNILGRERLELLAEEGNFERFKDEQLKAAAISRQTALLKLQIIDAEEVGKQVEHEVDLLSERNRLGQLRLDELLEAGKLQELLDGQYIQENISLKEQIAFLTQRAVLLKEGDPLAEENLELEKQRDVRQRILDVVKLEKTTTEDVLTDVRLTIRELNAENAVLSKQARILAFNSNEFAKQLQYANLITETTSAYIDKLTGLDRIDLSQIIWTEGFIAALAAADMSLEEFLRKFQEVNRTPLLAPSDEFLTLKNNITAARAELALFKARAGESPDLSWTEEATIRLKEIFTTTEGFSFATQQIGDGFNNLAQGFQNLYEAGDKENDKQFERHKQFAIAATIVSTLNAAVESFKNAGGWPWGIPAAAAALFYGYSQVRKIQAMEPGKTSAGGASISAAPSYFGSLGGQSLAGPGNVAPAEGTGISGTSGGTRQPQFNQPFQTQQASGQVVIESPSTSVEVAAPTVALPQLIVEAPATTFPELNVAAPQVSLDVPNVVLPAFDPTFSPTFSPTLAPQFEVPQQEAPVFQAPTASVQPLTVTSASSLTVEPINLNITIQGELRGSARSMVAAIKQEVNAQVASGITDPLGIQKSQQRIASRFS